MVNKNKFWVALPIKKYQTPINPWKNDFKEKSLNIYSTLKPTRNGLEWAYQSAKNHWLKAF